MPFLLSTVPLGPDRCRLLSRGRSANLAGVAGWAARLAAEVMDPVTLVMTRKVLLGIKHRAERAVHPAAP